MFVYKRYRLCKYYIVLRKKCFLRYTLVWFLKTCYRYLFGKFPFWRKLCINFTNCGSSLCLVSINIGFDAILCRRLYLLVSRKAVLQECLLVSACLITSGSLKAWWSLECCLFSSSSFSLDSLIFSAIFQRALKRHEGFVVLLRNWWFC